MKDYKPNNLGDLFQHYYFWIAAYFHVRHSTVLPALHNEVKEAWASACGPSMAKKLL